MTAAIAALLVAGGAYLWFEFVADDRVETRGPSMNPTMVGTHKVDIEASAYHESPPRLGDIVMLQGPAGVDTGACGDPHRSRSPCAAPVGGYSLRRLIKRVVAGPGDSVAFAPDGHLIRNGRLVREPYIRPCPETCALPSAIMVPSGHYFVAGDNRRASSDSRLWGPVPLDAIDGRVVSPETTR